MLLSIEHLSKYHNEKCIVDDISFAIEEQDKIALVGVNGTGKTTLLRILSNTEPFQSGKIIRKNGLRIAYLPQSPVFEEKCTILDYIHKNIDTEHPIEEFEMKAILTKLGLQNHQETTDFLSGGQKKRVALAAALLQPCDLLILDEPTNHLDNTMIEWLEKYLIKLNRALVMVTHDRYFLDRISNKILEIDRSKIYMYQGNYRTFLELKAQREEMARASDRKRQSILRKELEWVKAGVQARGTKSRERLERYEKLNEQANVTDVKNIKLGTLTSRLGKKTIEVEGLGKSYQENILFKDFEYNVKRRDRIGILGDNGCGKSTLLHILAKEITPDKGTVVHGETVRIAYYKQGHDDMNMQMRVIDYISESSNEIETEDGKLSASQILEQFLFDAQLQYSNIGRLSGGERRRLYLLKVLMTKPNVLFLDEPTNDLDIQTLTILEDYLDQFDGAVITVSHDRYFLDRVCDKVFVFQKDKTLKQYIGGYSFYLEHEKKDSQISKKDNQSEYREQKKQRNEHLLKLTSKEKKDLETIDMDLEQIQKNIDEIDIEMNEVTADFQKIAQLSKQREELHRQLEEKMEYWMFLNDKKQAIEDSRK